MSYLIVGLGNKGEEYQNTRHNTGKMVVAKIPAQKGLKVLELDSLMNNSGAAVAKVIKNKKAAEKLVVIYDDLDLPLGALKVSWNRGDGGHRGLASIIRALKTREFIRVRVGICPTTPSGKLKKLTTEKQVVDFILGEFKNSEHKILQKVIKRAVEAVETIVQEGREVAMNRFNS